MKLGQVKDRGKKLGQVKDRPEVVSPDPSCQEDYLTQFKMGRLVVFDKQRHGGPISFNTLIK